MQVCQVRITPQQINPFTPKAPLIHYWNTHISNREHFFLSKALHLTLHHYAILNNLLNQNFKPFTLKNYSNGLNANKTKNNYIFLNE